MKYQTDLEKAQELENQGNHIQAAKILEDIGTKCMREEGEERSVAPKIIARSIARYLLAGENARAQDLAYQVLFMKEEDPFLSLQVESAISVKRNIIRAFVVSKIPTKLEKEQEIFNGIPQNRKILKMNTKVTIKNQWEYTVFGEYKPKFDLISQEYQNPQEMINFILATQTGISIIGAESASGEKIMIILAVTFNDDPVEIITIK
ncbi:MAG: hypothetical protein FK734_12925 [Asgard group archaeon]|nr:hypothetical protein [Asgard group archaeon]